MKIVVFRNASQSTLFLLTIISISWVNLFFCLLCYELLCNISYSHQLFRPIWDNHMRSTLNIYVHAVKPTMLYRCYVHKYNGVEPYCNCVAPSYNTYDHNKHPYQRPSSHMSTILCIIILLEDEHFCSRTHPVFDRCKMII